MIELTVYDFIIMTLGMLFIGTQIGWAVGRRTK